MTPDTPPTVPPRAKVVLSYFLRHPHAADSLEGVVRWRLPQETVDLAVDQIQQALEWLEAQGFIVRDTGPVGPAVFRLNREKSGDAERFLSSPWTAAADDRTPASADRDRRPSVTGRADQRTAARGPLMARALAWIDATLQQYHQRNPPEPDDRPGLFRSPTTLARLMGPRIETTAAGEAMDDAAARELMAAIDDADRAQPLAVLYRALRLTPLELHALLLVLAPELDVRYQTIYGILQDDISRRAASLGLVCALLGDPIATREALLQAGALTGWRLLDGRQPDGGASLPYADEPLRLDATVVSWLLGDDAALFADHRVAAVVRPDAWPGGAWMPKPANATFQSRLSAVFEGEPASDWVVLAGREASGWRAIIEAHAILSDRPIARISLPPAPTPIPAGADEATEAREMATRLTRAILLTGITPVVDLAGTAPDRQLPARLVVEALVAVDVPGVAIVADPRHVIGALPADRCALYSSDAPDASDSTGALRAAMADSGLTLSRQDAARLASAYPLSIEGIADAVRLAVCEGAARQPEAAHVDRLHSAVRRVAAPDLPRFARRIEPVFQLGEVVLPADRHAQLEEIVSHVKHAPDVLNTWGFGTQLPYGRGIAALFSGPSGTGKTMAAQGIARALRTDIYMVDLSRVMSKYIGESEKNLDAVFNDAERAGALLLFDEADALFGKRSEIKDAHDRYANIEVAYLLQRIEAFSGIAILTTNFRQNLDQAFLRRLRFVVEFPKPDARARETIWRQCFPEDAPLAEDVNLRLLASELDLSGGNIRQVTLRAAFAAASEGAPAIAMRHVVTAARAELIKLGMTAAERDLAAFQAATSTSPARVA